MSAVDKKLVRNWVRQQSGPAKRAALPAVLLACVGTILAIGQAWCLAAIIDRVARDRAAPSLSPIGIFAVLSLFRAGCMIVQEQAAARAGISARARLRRSVLDSVIGIGPALLRRQHSGEIAALLVDRIEVLDGYFARWLPASMSWVLLPCLSLSAIFWFNPRAALILAVCGALVPVAQAVFGIGAALASRNQFLAMVRLQSRFLDRIRGIATIVLANADGREAEALSRAADELRRRTMKILRVAFLSSAAIDIAMVVAIILIVLTQGHFLHRHETSGISVHATPDFTATLFALLLVPEFFAPLRGLALAYQDRAHAAGAAEAMHALEHGGDEGIIDGTGMAEAIGPVTVEGDAISYRWREDLPFVFEALDFTVAPGDILVVDGASGAGKSTLIELLLGFIHPVSGRILFNGRDTRAMRGREVAQYLAWIGQRPVLFAGTLRENLLFARPDADDEALDAAVRAAAIDSFLPLLPKGLDTEIGEGGFGLSGGQAQRVAIARAFLKDAPLLLLDEPTAHLDPDTERDIIESLACLAEGRTVVLSSHSPAMRALGTQTLSLSHGAVTGGHP